jgi:hypothetical protein
MAIAGTRVSTVEMPCFRISTSLEPPNFSRCHNICKEVTGCPASLSSHSFGTCRLARSVSGPFHCRIQTQRSHRICQIELSCSTIIHAEKLWTAMQVPFPELAVLHVSLATALYKSDLPDSFLCGSAPRLRHLALVAVPFPGLPNLLLSATHLVYLGLFYTPCSGYISPEAMAKCLSVLTSLEELYFHHLEPSPDQESRRPLPPPLSVLPALTNFEFKGVNKYFEDFVSRIDAPRLYRLSIMHFDNVHVDHAELEQFISRTPRFGASNEAHLILDDDGALVRLQSQPDHGMVEVKIFCREPFSQFLFLAQICAYTLHPLLTMDNLYFEGGRFSPLFFTERFENEDWLDLLLPFTAVKNLYLSEAFWPRIVPALQEVTEGRTTELLPALQNVLLEGFQPSEPVQEDIAEFISARQLTSCPVAISVWDRD